MKKQMKKEKNILLDATELKDGIYVAANIGVQIIMYVQIFILVKAAFFLQGIQRSSLIIKKPTKTKQNIYFYETDEKSGTYCK